jgi:hypothetical protein
MALVVAAAISAGAAADKPSPTISVSAATVSSSCTSYGATGTVDWSGVKVDRVVISLGIPTPDGGYFLVSDQPIIAVAPAKEHGPIPFSFADEDLSLGVTTEHTQNVIVTAALYYQGRFLTSSGLVALDPCTA